MVLVGMWRVVDRVRVWRGRVIALFFFFCLDYFFFFFCILWTFYLTFFWLYTFDFFFFIYIVLVIWHLHLQMIAAKQFDRMLKIWVCVCGIILLQSMT